MFSFFFFRFSARDHSAFQAKDDHLRDARSFISLVRPRSSLGADLRSKGNDPLVSKSTRY